MGWSHSNCNANVKTNPHLKHTEYTDKGKLLASQDLSATAGLWQHSGILCRRYEIHNALKAAAVAIEGVGPPVKLNMNSRVTKVISESATLVFGDASTLSGDLVIGADGIKVCIEQRRQVPFDSESSRYRANAYMT